MAGLLDQIGPLFNTPAGTQGPSRLLGNPLFNIGMGLLAARGDARINPATAAFGGLLGASQQQQQYKDQEEKDRQQAAMNKLKVMLPGLLNPTYLNAEGGYDTTRQGPLGELGPLASSLAQADPGAAMKWIPDMLTAMKQPAGRTANPHQNFIGTPYQGTDGHTYQNRVDPNDVTQPQLWDLTDQKVAPPGTGQMADQPTISYDLSGRGRIVSKTGVSDLPGGSAAEVQSRLNERAQSEFEYKNWQGLPDVLNRYDRLQSMVDVMRQKDTPLAHGFASYFPTLRGSDTSNWEAARNTFKSSQTLTTLRDMKAQTQTGASGLGNTNQYEIEMLEQAGNRISEATSKPEYDEATQDFEYWLKRSRKIAKVQAGLDPTDMSREPSTLGIAGERPPGSGGPVSPLAEPPPAQEAPAVTAPPPGVSAKNWNKYGAKKPGG